MKNRVLVISFIIILLGSTIFGIIYLSKQIMKMNESEETNENNQINIYKPEEKINLINNVEPFLFTKSNVKLFYEGGPSHWGSRNVTFDSMSTLDNSKIVYLHVIDESDMKGEDPKKEWNQKWEATSDGSLYIDDMLMLKSPIVVGQNWDIYDYKPVAVSGKKYKANITITSVQSSLDDSNLEVKQVNTILTINDIKTVDGGVYTENRVFESGVGIKEFSATEPTISQLNLHYGLSNTSNFK